MTAADVKEYRRRADELETALINAELEIDRLRIRFRLCDGCGATLVRCNEHIEAGAIKCCPDCRHARAA